MTLSELYTILNSISGFSGKVRYGGFPEKSNIKPPRIAYIETDSNNFGADNIVYYPIKRIDIELTETQRSDTTEGSVESALTSNGIYFEKSVDYIEDEKIYQIVYEIEV